MITDMHEESKAAAENKNVPNSTVSDNNNPIKAEPDKFHPDPGSIAWNETNAMDTDDCSVDTADAAKITSGTYLLDIILLIMVL